MSTRKPRNRIRKDNGHIRISLCMIVRDSAATLEACLHGIRPWVDQMIIVDTGSVDQTVNIAESYGGEIHHFPWCDDFSAARNESLRHARGDWIFWMDSDDTISEHNGAKLRGLAATPLADSPMAYVLQVHCPACGQGELDGVTIVDHVKMFRNLADLRFEGRIHEQILPALRRLNGELRWTDIFVTHSGSDQSKEGRQLKFERDQRILQLELAERPDHPFTLFNVGMTHADLEEYDKAANALSRSLEVSDPGESHVRKAYALLIGCLYNLKRQDEAWQNCKLAQKMFPDDPELHFRSGILHHHFGRMDEAIQAYRAALRPPPERCFSSMDAGINGYKARHNLALVYVDLQQFDQSELQWRHVLEEVPHYRAAWHGLVQSLLSQQKYVTAQVEADKAAREPQLRCDAMVLMAMTAEALGDITQARQLLSQASKDFPGNNELSQYRCRFLYEQGPEAEALEALSDLCRRTPEDPAACHNLGSVYARMGCFETATDWYRRSLDIRPESIGTILELGSALEQSGKKADALEVYDRAEQIAPNDSRVKKCMVRVATEAAI